MEQYINDITPKKNTPDFGQLVELIEKNFRLAMTLASSYTSEEIAASWQRYKALNHLHATQPPSAPSVDWDRVKLAMEAGHTPETEASFQAGYAAGVDFAENRRCAAPSVGGLPKLNEPILSAEDMRQWEAESAPSVDEEDTYSATDYYLDHIQPNNADKKFIPPTWAVYFAEKYADFQIKRLLAASTTQGAVSWFHADDPREKWEITEDESTTPSKDK